MLLNGNTWFYFLVIRWEKESISQAHFYTVKLGKSAILIHFDMYSMQISYADLKIIKIKNMQGRSVLFWQIPVWPLNSVSDKNLPIVILNLA